MTLPSPTNPPGSLRDDLRVLERWLWIAGGLASLLLVVTIAVVVGLGDGPAPVVFAGVGLVSAVHAVMLLVGAARFARARNRGGSVARAFQWLRWTILASPVISLAVGAWYTYLFLMFE